MTSIPTIAIVGKPNVGKSTIFNRLIGKKHAITTKEAGTTRDRISHTIDINDIEALLVDTGGLETEKKENIEEDIQTQAQLAIGDADLIFFVIDGANELSVDDFAAADILRKSTKPIIFIANKCDNKEIEQNIFNLYELGFGEPLKLSAIHKVGIDQLLTKTEKELKSLGFEPREEIKSQEDLINICIIGKPNAGKSSLVNALFGSEKIIVSDIAGTTRDATDTKVEYQDKNYNLIDTAGLRRPGRRERGIEAFSALRCISSIERSDIVVLLIDGEKGVTTQDVHLAQHALEAEKGLILAINKIDLFEIPEEDRERLIYKLRKRFIFVPWAPVVFVSAKNKKNIHQILEISDQIYEERGKRIQTAEFNSFMQKITFKHLPASTKIQKPKFMYGSQVDTHPPKFVLFFKNSKNLHFSYPRYLENQIREEYGFGGTAINITFKSREEDDRKKR